MPPSQKSGNSAKLFSLKKGRAADIIGDASMNRWATVGIAYYEQAKVRAITSLSWFSGLTNR